MINGIGIIMGRRRNPNTERIKNDKRRETESESTRNNDSETKRRSHEVASPSVMRLLSHPNTLIDRRMIREIIKESARGIFFRVSARKNVAIAILESTY